MSIGAEAPRRFTAAQCEGIGLFADMPVRGPGERAEAGDAARLGHAGEAKIEPVSQQSGHEDAIVGRYVAGTQMREAVRERGPARDLGEEVGDPDARQRGIEPFSRGLGRRRLLDWR